jgi:hypothetical protein
LQSSILSLSAAEVVAKISVGLSYAESRGNASTPILVSSRHVAEAYRVYLKTERDREVRLTAPKDLKENLDAHPSVIKGPNVSDEDPIVKRVKQSSDLSKHEKHLLKSIVKSRKY